MEVTRTLDIQTLWDEVSQTLKGCISVNSFNAWLSAVYPMRFENEGRVLILGVPNEMTRDWIQKKYQKIITSEVVKINPSVRTIKFMISRRVVKKRLRSKNKSMPNLLENTPIQKSVSLPLDLHSFDESTNLNPDLVFDDFFVAPYNRFAYTAAEVVIEKLGTLYNPFYVYGPTGVGKTHLLQAMGNKVKQMNDSLNIYYTTSEAFMENYISAIKNDRVKQFRNVYTNYNLFIIDDVHFLEKSDSTIVEIFHLFNMLINKNSQIVLSSDQPPTQLDKMDDRIRTRLNSGVVIDIEKPKYEDMRIICTKKAEKMGIQMVPEATDYVIEKISQSIREINGALKSIHLHTRNDKKEGVIGLEDVKKFIKNHIRPKRYISYENVVDIVCKFYNVDQGLLSTKLRKREVVYARQIIMYIFREHLGFSYSFIGKQFGDRDHTTVMHACERIKKLLHESSITQREYDNIIKRIDG